MVDNSLSTEEEGKELLMYTEDMVSRKKTEE